MMKSKKNVKIAIINPPSLAVDDDRVEPHLGTLYIASALRECNFDNVVVFDMSGSPDEEEIEAKMKAIPFARVCVLILSIRRESCGKPGFLIRLLILSWEAQIPRECRRLLLNTVNPTSL